MRKTNSPAAQRTLERALVQAKREHRHYRMRPLRRAIHIHTTIGEN